MRTITAAQDAVLTRGKYKVELRVEIEDSTSTLVDVSDLEGQNWIKSVEISDDVDASVSTATVKLFAQRYNLSMHPLDEDSKINLPGGVYAPFLDVRRQVRVLAATVPQNYTAVTADFELIFDGFIDMIPESGKSTNEIALACRDKGAVLQDTFIEDLERYGDGSVDGTDNTITGGLLEDIIQDIFDNWVPGTTLFSENGTGGTPFLAGDSPGFVIEKWDVAIQSVMDAIRIGANSIGWECRYRFQDNQGEFEVQLYEPDRASAVVDRTFGPSGYIDVTNFDIDVSKVRNVIEITYFTDPDAEPAVLEVSDAASITRYGRRWMGIVEAASSPINTAAEATQMADAILADLREPDRDQSVEMPFFWAVQLGDRYTFSANGVNYSTDQTWAVVGYRHFLEQGRQRTIIETRRAPSGGVIHWWGKGQIGGLGFTLKDKPPTTPTPSLDILDHGILVQWDSTLARAGRVSIYEVHASTVGAGFTPDATTLVAKTRGTRFRINGLDQLTEYFIKIIAVDDEGNIGSASSAVSNEPGFLRGAPGRIETTRPAASALQPLQMVFNQDGSFSQRKFKTYTERLNDLFTATPIWNLGFDETSGTNAADDSGNSRDFTYINTGDVTLDEPAAIGDGGASALFSDNGANSGHARLLGENITGVTSFTFQTWVKFPAPKGASSITLIEVDDAGGGIDFQLIWRTAVGGDDMQIIINGSTITPSGKQVVDATELEERSWFLLTVTWDNGAGDVEVYINDVNVDSFTGASAAATLVFDDFFLGATVVETSGLDGRLDRAVMWTNEVATLAQIKDVFYNGRAVDTQFDETRIEAGGGVGSDQARHVPFFVVELSQDIAYTNAAQWMHAAFGRVLVDPWSMFVKQVATSVAATSAGTSPVTIPPGWGGYWEFGFRFGAFGVAANSFFIAGIAIDVDGTGFPGGSSGNPQYLGGYAEVSPAGPSGNNVLTPPVFLEEGGQAKPKIFSQDATYTLDQAITDATVTHFWGRYLFQKRSLDRGSF